MLVEIVWVVVFGRSVPGIMMTEPSEAVDVLAGEDVRGGWFALGVAVGEGKGAAPEPVPLPAVDVFSGTNLR